MSIATTQHQIITSISDTDASGNNSLVSISVAFSLVLLALHVAGYFYPSGLLWGIHFLGFLPFPYLIVYVVATLVGLYYCTTSNMEKLLRPIMKVMEEKQWRFIVLTCALFTGIAIAFRIQVPLLGDSFTFTNNLENTIKGEHRLSFGNEPLAFAFLYAMASLLHASSHTEIMSAIFIGELLLGYCCIVTTSFSVLLLFPESYDVRRLLVFLYLCVSPSLQLLFGYAESYAVVLLALSVTLLVVLLYLRHRIPLWVVAPVFILLIFVHYLGVLLLPLLFYLAYIEYKENGLLPVGIGVLSGATVIAAIFAAVGFEFHRFVPDAERSHLLSFSDATDQYAAYSLLAPYHVLDLANLLLLMAPGALLLLSLSIRKSSELFATRVHVALFLCAIPFFLFLMAAKFDLGMAKDWDVTAPYFAMVALCAAFLFLQDGSMARVRSMGIVIVATALSSWPYFTINATEAASVMRVASLMDRRIMPQSGYYQTSYHLTMYRYYRKEADSMVTIWQRYVTQFPNDTRGYAKLAKSYWETGERSYPAIADAYERWLQLAPSDTATMNDYANFCLFAAAASFNAGRPSDASAQYRRAIDLNPKLLAAYNNLGLLYHNQGLYDSALVYYRKATVIDSMYARGYRNIGSVYMAMGQPNVSIPCFAKAIALDSSYVGAYEQMGQALEAVGKKKDAMSMYRQAAHLGSAAAQHVLTQNGYSW
ncbi:MAG: tetratricopeptide repeat protein [Ignavibacteriae bacterium]|nr:tetratricopeptide repeat protein [Ignavibacteria bacterium]MBI3363792.1 tetratricopeptide repeat protein [Ignavibacteriota bacterium]